MKFGMLGDELRTDLATLFKTTFGASEGEQEGALIGALAARLAEAIDGTDILCFGAHQGPTLVGAVFFTRLRFDDDHAVFMLAPVAVAPLYQRMGAGKALIRFSLDAMAARGAAVAVTYGDPAFYGKVGFEPLSECVLQAPMMLSMSVGWQVQSLDGQPIQARRGRPRCVEAFRDSAYW